MRYHLFGSVLFAVAAHATQPINRQCFEGSPPLCNNSITGDTSCRGINTTSIDGWKRMDCDYALYNVPTTKRKTNKWIVIHAGTCDTYTGELGDWFAPAMDLNLFGLRTCGGFSDSLCANLHHYDSCEAFHTHWNFPSQTLPASSPYGLGFNPPALVDIYHTPNTTMLFLHEYGSANTSYNWYPANGCNLSDKPDYMCLAGIDPSYQSKFSAIKTLLENGLSNTTAFPCRLEVIDTVPYAQDQQANTPCTGILREYNNPSVVGGTPGASNWAWEMTEFMTRAIQLATQVSPDGNAVKLFKEAISISLCRDFQNGSCADSDQ